MIVFTYKKHLKLIFEEKSSALHIFSGFPGGDLLPFSALAGELYDLEYLYRGFVI